MSRRLVAWVVITGAYGRGFTDPSLPGCPPPDDEYPVYVAMDTRRLKREQVESVRRAGREAWRIHHGQGEAAS